MKDEECCTQAETLFRPYEPRAETLFRPYEQSYSVSPVLISVFIDNLIHNLMFLDGCWVMGDDG